MNLFLKVWIHYYIVFYPNLKKWSRNHLFPSTLYTNRESLNRGIEGTKCHLERQRPTLCTTSNAGHFRLSRQQRSGQGRVVSTCVVKRQERVQVRIVVVERDGEHAGGPAQTCARVHWCKRGAARR